MNHRIVRQQEQFDSVTAAQCALVLLLTSTAIFLLTAAGGVWIAYDRSIATIHFIAIVVGLLGLFAILLPASHNRETWLIGLGFGATLLVFGFSLTLWREPSTDNGMLAAGLALLLPLPAGTILWAWHRRQWMLSAIVVVALALGLFALYTTADRSALLGLLVGFLSTIIVRWRLEHVHRLWIARVVDSSVVIGVSGLVLAGWLFLVFPQSDVWIEGSAFGDALLSRLHLWRSAMPLIQDYQFTGSGLGSTSMVYATYIFLIHVPFHSHLHNLFLQIAVEQGLPGLIGIGGMVGATLFGLLRTYPQLSTNLRPFYLVTWMSTIALITYGLLDSEIYISGGASLMFAPFGFALLLLTMPDREIHQAEPVRNAEDEHTRRMVAVADGVGWYHARLCLVGCAPFLLLAVLWFRPGAQAAQQANWGAIAQARAELSLYQGSTWPLQDAMRRNGVDLTTAMRYYYASLALNPDNVTAHRRLGQILLSQGNMSAAQQHLVLAHAAAPNQLVTRQLLGEVYGVTGHIEEAALLWRTVDNGNGQLETRHWWYNYLGAQTEADRIKQVIGALSH